MSVRRAAERIAETISSEEEASLFAVRSVCRKHGREFAKLGNEISRRDAERLQRLRLVVIIDVPGNSSEILTFSDIGLEVIRHVAEGR